MAAILPNWYALVGIFSARVCSRLETSGEVVGGHLTGMRTSAYQWPLLDNDPIVIPEVIEPNPVFHANAMNLKQRGNGPVKVAHQPRGATREPSFTIVSVGLYRLIEAKGNEVQSSIAIGQSNWPVELDLVASRTGQSNLIWRSCSSTYGQKAMRSSRQ